MQECHHYLIISEKCCKSYERNMQFGFALNTETFIQTVLPWLVYNFSKIMHAKHSCNSKSSPHFPRAKTATPPPWIAFSTGNSYGDVYTDREETENEKRRKNCHSPFSPHSPTRSLKHDNGTCGGYPLKMLFLVDCGEILYCNIG